MYNCCLLYTSYLYGMGTEIDYQKAYEYFKQSDNLYAQYSLGVMYQRGLGVTQSDAIADVYKRQGYMKIHMTIMLQSILCLIGVDITD